MTHGEVGGGFRHAIRRPLIEGSRLHSFSRCLNAPIGGPVVMTIDQAN